MKNKNILDAPIEKSIETKRLTMHNFLCFLNFNYIAFKIVFYCFYFFKYTPQKSRL